MTSVDKRFALRQTGWTSRYIRLAVNFLYQRLRGLQFSYAVSSISRQLQLQLGHTWKHFFEVNTLKETKITEEITTRDFVGLVPLFVDMVSTVYSNSSLKSYSSGF